MENLLLGNVIESGNISPFSCPFCGYNGSLDLMGADRFPVLRTLQVIGAGRRAARCPKCKSSDKERLVYTYLKEVEKIEKEMQYPGTIKVTVIRETRVTEEAK